MPIYEYKCQQCGYVNSFLEQGRAKVKHACEKCQSGELEKLFSTFAVNPQRSSQRCNTCTDGSCPLSGSGA
jgi:putative FmdB family regulatory protein